MAEEMDKKAIRPIIEEILEESLNKRLGAFVVRREKEIERVSLLERIINVEEELKAQRELFFQRFEAIDKRFEDLIHYMDKRFEDMNKRFTQVTWLISTGMAFIMLLMTVYKFIH